MNSATVRGRSAVAFGLICAMALAASVASTPIIPPKISTERQAWNYCSAISEAFADQTTAAALIASYDIPVTRRVAEPGLWQVAFVYDNALAAIALVACGRISEARRIANALVSAVQRDRFYRDHRLRNAYSAGVLNSGVPRLPGWWDTGQQRWLEDHHHVGTSTGNVAWAALALLTVAAATDDPEYLNAAAAAMGWIEADTCGQVRHGEPSFGFTGGYDGHEPKPAQLTWKSTEHNVDALAAFLWLAAIDMDDPDRLARWRRCARSAEAFLDAMFEPTAGRFRIGTKPDGVTPEDSGSGLDAELWPILVLGDAKPEWQRALAWVERNHVVPGGFDFNDDRDGLWVEGTAQAALVYKALGRHQRAEELLNEIGKEIAPNGFLYATRGATVTTGLALGPELTSPDFIYRRLPHLGATAWAALAAAGWNPLSGRFIDRGQGSR